MTGDNRIPDRIRAVLSDPMLDEAAMLDQVNAILDSAPPAPRVFFPGDTVPAGVPVLYRKPSGLKTFVGDKPWAPNFGPMWEIVPPSEDEWQAAVDRARAEQVEALRADRHAEITEAEASEARDG